MLNARFPTSDPPVIIGKIMFPYSGSGVSRIRRPMSFVCDAIRTLPSCSMISNRILPTVLISLVLPATS